MEEWKREIDDFFKEKEKKNIEKEVQIEQKKLDIQHFYSSKVIPAFEELKTELERHGRKVGLVKLEDYASITVTYEGIEEINYAIEVRGRVPYPEITLIERSGKRQMVEGTFRVGTQGFDVLDVSKEEIIRHFLNKYKSYI